MAEHTMMGDDRGAASKSLALLDRLAHRAHILECVGESYRFRERMERENQKKSDG